MARSIERILIEQLGALQMQVAQLQSIIEVQQEQLAQNEKPKLVAKKEKE